MDPVALAVSGARMPYDPSQSKYKQVCCEKFSDTMTWDTEIFSRSDIRCDVCGKTERPIYKNKVQSFCKECLIQAMYDRGYEICTADKPTWGPYTQCITYHKYKFNQKKMKPAHNADLFVKLQ